MPPKLKTSVMWQWIQFWSREKIFIRCLVCVMIYRYTKLHTYLAHFKYTGIQNLKSHVNVTISHVKIICQPQARLGLAVVNLFAKLELPSFTQILHPFQTVRGSQVNNNWSSSLDGDRPWNVKYTSDHIVCLWLGRINVIVCVRDEI